MKKTTSNFNLNNFFKKKKLSIIIFILLCLSVLFEIYLYFIFGETIFVKSLFYFFPLYSFLIFLIFKINILINVPQDLRKIKIKFKKKFPINDSRRLLFLNLILIFLSYILLLTKQTRSLYYLYLVSIAGSVLFFQVLILDKFGKLYFFAQSILISLGLTYGVTLKYSYFFGSGDIITHMSYVSDIVNTGFNQISGTYYNFPAYHIILSISNVISGYSLISNFFITTGIISLLFLFLTFIITKKIINNIKFSYLCTLFVLFSPTFIYSSWYFITRTLGVIFFLFIFYLLIIRLNSRKNLIFSILLLLFSIILLLTHHVTSIFFINIFTLILIVFIKNGKIKNLKKIFIYYIFVMISFISYYFYVSLDFTKSFKMTLEESIKRLFVTESSEIIQDIQMIAPTTIDALKSLIGSHYDMFVIFFSLFWFIYVIKNWKYQDNLIKLLTIIGFISLALTIPDPIKTMFVMDFLLYRLPLFTQIFWIIFALFGFIIFVKILTFRKKNNIGNFILISVFLFFVCFSSVIQTAGDIDEISIISHGKNAYFSNSELKTFQFVKNQKNNSIIYTDYHSMRYLNSICNISSSELIKENLNRNNEKSNSIQYILFRISTNIRDGLLIKNSENSEFKRQEISTNLIRNVGLKYSKIYNNRVFVYITSME